MFWSALLVSGLAAALAYDCKAPKPLATKKWNGYEYLISPTFVTFDQCKNFCEDYDMQVASIHSATEAAVVDSFCTQAAASKQCFLGMECVDDLVCTWTDGTPVDWTPYTNVQTKSFYKCATSKKEYGLAGYYPHDCNDYLPCMCKSVAAPTCGSYNVAPSELPITFEACMESDKCSTPTCDMDVTVHTPICLVDKAGLHIEVANGTCCEEVEEPLCCDMDFKKDGVVKINGGDKGTIYQWKIQAQDKYNQLSKMVDCVVRVGEHSTTCPGCSPGVAAQ